MRAWLKGVDVSYVQKIGSGGLIKNTTSGATLADIRDFDYVIVKATQGDFVDPQWANSYAVARKFGKPVMAYHFNDNRVGIAKQVNLFLATAKDADFLWVDQEGTYAFTDAQTADFITRVRNAGRMCGLYHSASGFSGVSCDGKWVADYRTESLKDHNTPVAGWDMWQFSAEGGPNGLGLDLNWVKPESFLVSHLGLQAASQADLDAQALVIAKLKTDLAACQLAHDQTVMELGTAKAALNSLQIVADGLTAERDTLLAGLTDANDRLLRVEEDRAAAQRLLGLS